METRDTTIGPVTAAEQGERPRMDGIRAGIVKLRETFGEDASVVMLTIAALEALVAEERAAAVAEEDAKRAAKWCAEDQAARDRRESETCTKENPCCERRNEYNGYPHESGPAKFRCPKSCGCHD
jgi:hypothetical protein